MAGARWVLAGVVGLVVACASSESEPVDPGAPPDAGTALDADAGAGAPSSLQPCASNAAPGVPATCANSCPTGEECLTHVTCGPPLRLPDGGFESPCFSLPPSGDNRCHRACTRDGDCAPGEACRSYEVSSRCSDTSVQRGLCCRPGDCP